MFLRGLAPLPWPSCSLMWMFYEDLQMLLYWSCINCFILLQIWPQLIGLSTGSTQEGQTQHNWKIVEWNIKHQTSKHYMHIIQFLDYLNLCSLEGWRPSPGLAVAWCGCSMKIYRCYCTCPVLIVSFYYRYDLSLSGLVLVRPRKASHIRTVKLLTGT